jgi:ABC-type uncharacterized transport system permease subunit
MILALSAWWGFAVAVGAALAYAVLAMANRRLDASTLRSLLLAAWLLHALMLADGLLGEPPRFGFAPALSMTVWLVLTVYAIESRLFPQLRPNWALAGLGSAVVILTLIFPGTSYHVIASPWLPLHWALGIASYGLFAAAVVHGWLMNRSERAIRLAAPTDAGVPLLTLERLTFRFVEAGFVLLSAGAGLEVEPQDGIFSTGLADLCRAAGGACPAGLAWPAGGSGAVPGIWPVAARLRRFTLCS